MTVEVRTEPAVEVRPKTVPEILRHAALVVEELGLARGEFQDQHGRACALGAINIAAVGNASFSGDHAPESAQEAAAALAHWLGPYPSASIVGWNDDPDRTAADVAAGLRSAADDFDAGRMW